VKSITLLLTCLITALSALTIAEKKAGLSQSGGDLDRETEKFLIQVNAELAESQQNLRRLTAEAYDMHLRQVLLAEFEPVVQQIQEVRAEIVQLQIAWREMAARNSHNEIYALFHQPDTVIEQLVIDYGAQDYVYVMTPEIASIHLSVDSNLPIPRASWGEVLELILTQNGIGIRQLNPFLRQLYLMKNEKSSLKVITNNRADLDLLNPTTRICFVLSPEASEVRRIGYFLENFVNPDNTVIQVIGRDILIVASVSDVQDLLKMYDFIAMSKGGTDYKAVSLSGVPAKEMAVVLNSIFDPNRNAPAPPRGPGAKGKAPVFVPFDAAETNGLRVIVLENHAQALFLVGSREEIMKAEAVIREVESQIGGGREKTVYWYTCKQSDPSELAQILASVYDLLVASGAGIDKRMQQQFNENELIAQALQTQRQILDLDQALRPPPVGPGPLPLPPASDNPYQPLNFYQGGNFPINPAPIGPAFSESLPPPVQRGNFIVDIKTGSIIMVVEAVLLPKIKEIIKKLDVPKKMVQLDVLLFEKRMDNRQDYGLNLLKIGSAASQSHASSTVWNDIVNIGEGILQFIISREKSGSTPAYDAIYSFLLTQNDITINSNPSVLTVNQTPAFISIQDEISINTGVYEIASPGGSTLKDSFTRAQYGITLKITPIVHTSYEGEEWSEDYDSVTLVSDILFDTFQLGSRPDRPDVTRRNIKNEARVADGETVILGGLRRKNTQDFKEAIPYLGELPGLGKLFSISSLRDNTTEMFIFITPTIVKDPATELELIRCEEMGRRPGDIPEFLCCLLEAREREQYQMLRGTMNILFGRAPDRCYDPCTHVNYTGCCCEGEYDGR